MTFVLPRQAIRRLRQEAAEQGTSVNAIVAALVAPNASRGDRNDRGPKPAKERVPGAKIPLERRRVDDPDYQAAMQESLRLMRKGFNLGTNAQIEWTRDEMYDR